MKQCHQTEKLRKNAISNGCRSALTCLMVACIPETESCDKHKRDASSRSNSGSVKDGQTQSGSAVMVQHMSLQCVFQDFLRPSVIMNDRASRHSFSTGKSVVSSTPPYICMQRGWVECFAVPIYLHM